MAHSLPFLKKSIVNHPLLITEDGLGSVFEFLSSREDQNRLLDFSSISGGSAQAQKDTSEGRVAQINLHGPMMHRASPLESMCGAQSYETYRSQLDSAFNNSSVEIIVLNCSSPGGDASGCFDLAQHIYDKKKSSNKKVIAYVEDLAASAAYALACTADEIIMEKTASVGSIGVITTHADMSGKLEKEGIVVTPIYAGKFKAAGNPYESLSEETKAMIQERVDSLYNIFVSHVAMMRNMSEEDIRATEAKVFLANDAIENGLADKIMSADEFMAYLEEDEDSMDFSLRKNTQDNKMSVEQIDMAEFEAMKTQLAELSETKEKLAAFELEKASMAEQLAAANALVEEKAAAEKAAKLMALQEKASAYSAFGLDAEKFAEMAMEANSDFVVMMTDALEQAKSTLEASAEFQEIGADAEGEGLESPKESASMKALKKQFKTKESK